MLPMDSGLRRNDESNANKKNRAASTHAVRLKGLFYGLKLATARTYFDATVSSLFTSFTPGTAEAV